MDIHALESTSAEIAAESPAIPESPVTPRDNLTPIQDAP